jgi:hypothetical protein
MEAVALVAGSVGRGVLMGGVATWPSPDDGLC